MHYIYFFLRFIYLFWAFSIFIFTLFIVFILIFLGSILFRNKTKYTFIQAILKAWAWTWTILIGIKPKIYNKEFCYENKHNIYAPNHSSYFDAVSLYLCIPTLFQALGKVEISKIPIFGYIYRNIVIMVDRDNKHNRAKAFLRMEKFFKQLDIVIFPQGTFRDKIFEPEVFNGAFRLAQDLKGALLPILFLDNYTIFPEKGIKYLKPMKCRMAFVSPISIEFHEKLSLDNFKLLYINYMENCISYCNQNDVNKLGEFSKNWLIDNIKIYY